MNESSSGRTGPCRLLVVWRAASSTLDAAGLASTWAVVNVLAGLEIACLALAEVLARVGGGMAAAAKHRRCRLAECCRAGSPGWCEATSRGAVGPQPAQPQTESEKGVHAKAACEKGHMVNGTTGIACMCSSGHKLFANLSTKVVGMCRRGLVGS